MAGSLCGVDEGFEVSLARPLDSWYPFSLSRLFHSGERTWHSLMTVARYCPGDETIVLLGETAMMLHTQNRRREKHLAFYGGRLWRRNYCVVLFPVLRVGLLLKTFQIRLEFPHFSLHTQQENWYKVNSQNERRRIIKPAPSGKCLWGIILVCIKCFVPRPERRKA